jgi:nucleoside-diphosphate-sugar epimerase
MTKKIVITGAAGLVGQNLISPLLSRGFTNIVAIDKHPTNSAIFQASYPSVRMLRNDLAASANNAGQWQSELAGCDALVISHAQIGGSKPENFVRNNIQATERLLEAALRHRVPYLVSISSSVVNSMGVDDYTRTKRAQEELIATTGIKQIVLRPNLMFGWFDRKHLGWLARFMQKVPLFPIPGSGKYLRQPLFAADFCQVIAAAIDKEMTGTYNITGQERIDYIDLIRAIKRITGAKARIQTIPYGLFRSLLKVNAVFDRDPAFTVDQLETLVTRDVFEVIDWPAIFGVGPTPLQDALEKTFRDPVYSKIVLDF